MQTRVLITGASGSGTTTLGGRLRLARGVIRVRRLREREIQRLGRADPAFLAWAAQYDEGTLEGRSRSKHEAWLAKRRWPVLRIDGDTSTESRLAQVLGVFGSNS